MSQPVFTFIPGFNISGSHGSQGSQSPTIAAAPGPNTSAVPTFFPAGTTGHQVVLYNIDGSDQRGMDAKRPSPKKKILLPPVSVMCTLLPQTSQTSGSKKSKKNY